MDSNNNSNFDGNAGRYVAERHADHPGFRVVKKSLYLGILFA
jgi:hypothetical protein